MPTLRNAPPAPHNPLSFKGALQAFSTLTLHRIQQLVLLVQHREPDVCEDLENF